MEEFSGVFVLLYKNLQYKIFMYPIIHSLRLLEVKIFLKVQTFRKTCFWTDNSGWKILTTDKEYNTINYL